MWEVRYQCSNFGMFAPVCLIISKPIGFNRFNVCEMGFYFSLQFSLK